MLAFLFTTVLGASKVAPMMVQHGISAPFAKVAFARGVQTSANNVLDYPAVSKPNYECGVCGGMGGGCPNCGGGYSFMDLSRVAQKAEMAPKPNYECGICGGMGVGCPNCGGGYSFMDLSRVAQKAEMQTRCAPTHHYNM